MIDRRTFLAGTGAMLLAAPLAASAQQARKAPRIGIVSTLPLEHPQARELSDAFRQGLRELGYVEGRRA